MRQLSIVSCQWSMVNGQWSISPLSIVKKFIKHVALKQIVNRTS